METLIHADWQRILKFLRSLYVPCSLDKFPTQVLTALPNLLGAEIFAITSFKIQDTPFSPQSYTFPHAEVGMAAESFTSQPQNFLAHPVSQHYVQTLDGQALAISDFFSESKFHRQDPLYTGFFRQFGLEDQMMIHFELPSITNGDRFHQGQEHLVLSISRDRRNFTERDRLILNLIRPHLKQAYENLAAFNQWQYQLVEQQQPTEQAALISPEALQMLGLTKREAEVLFCVAKDQSTNQIAKHLGISDRTVKKHLEHVYEKFSVQTRLAAVMYVLKHLGILT